MPTRRRQSAGETDGNHRDSSVRHGAFCTDGQKQTDSLTGAEEKKLHINKDDNN